MAEKVNLVSLGDSIATGTLTPFQNTFSYVFYIQNKFAERGCRPDVYRLARDGDTSNDLLWKLNHSQRFCETIEKAGYLTVSIGGNDLLRASSIPGFRQINVPTAARGTKGFTDNWPRIVNKIREINPHAEMVVLSLYNPYNHTRPDRKLCELTDRFLSDINCCIGVHAEHNYKIADIYAAFKQFSEGNMYRVSCLYPESVLRNPHPTPWAQRLIADLVFEQFGL